MCDDLGTDFSSDIDTSDTGDFSDGLDTASDASFSDEIEDRPEDDFSDDMVDVSDDLPEDDFEDEGLESFKSFIFNDKLMNELCIYGAFEENKLIGIMGTKNEGKHISLFFIKKEFHRKGIGKQLFDYSQCDCPANEITVNSSTYAIRFYESLGFEKTNDRQQTNGISYTPMKLISNK